MDNLISVIIPVYNSERYLNKCIDSILHQTYRNLEVICIDDGSTDHSVEIVKEYIFKDKRVKLYRNEAKGVSAARNYGLDKCKGQYVMFVDSDDWIELDICREALKIIENEKADVAIWSYIREYSGCSKYRYVLGDTFRIYQAEDIDILSRKMYGLIGEELSQPENANVLVTVWGKLYKKDKIQNIKFVDLKDIGTSEDTLFNIEFFHKVTKAIYIPECAYHYRKNNSTSITTKYNPYLYEQWNNLYNKMKESIQIKKNSAFYEEAFSNRVALGLVPLILNIVISEEGIRKQNIKIKNILYDEEYEKSILKLQTKYMPIHWKLFFGFAKIKCSYGMLLLGKIMQFMRGR